MAHPEPKCRWSENFDGVWETDCGEMHEFIAGTPQENKHRFCCYCGRKLAQRRYGSPEPASS